MSTSNYLNSTKNIPLYKFNMTSLEKGSIE